MLLSIIIFAVTYLLIITEKVDKSISALLGAGAVIMLHAAPMEELLGKVDLNVLSLLVGMMITVDILSTTGVFEWIAIVIARKAKGNGLVILIEFLLITALLSAFLDNVTTVILIAPITILITQILEIPTVPILILEAIFSNIGGTATLVGDPPNIIIGSQTPLGFNDFLMHLGPAVLLVTVILTVMTFFVFRKHVKASPETIKRIMSAKPELAIIAPDRMKRALGVLALILLGFFCSRLINVEPGIIALCGGLLMVVVCGMDMHKVLLQVEWTTILFFVGLFVLIGGMEANGVFEALGQHIVKATQGNLLLTTMAILWCSALFSAVVDNIPLVIAMIPLIKSIIPVFAAQKGIVGSEELIHVQVQQPLFWALALGACLGGNGSLIGASANVVIAQIARRNKYSLTFWGFTRYGIPMMLISLIICSAYMFLRYFMTGTEF
ncbi:MAG: ArsB/NhaD family transporter [Lentisphaerae bacterium]|nr:ArsB/NhaD family transporter [Lentisphaerota bacterium]MCP4100200.1 ArsB/NhaD family transporter [Lentisphaerota bacterium]